MFDSAKLKIDRANHHIRDVERQWGVFLEKKIHGIVGQSNAEMTTHTFSVQYMKEFPSEIALAIGDAIHNLRSALDHLTWEVVGRDRGTQDRYLKFPTGDDRTSFESTCKGMKTPSLTVKDVFKSLEAFPDGKGKFLYILSYLDNIDKHSILTPILQVSKITKMVVRNNRGEILRTIESPNPGGFVEGESLTIDTYPDNSFVDFNNDVDIAPDILFGDIKFVGYDPIIPTLAQLSDAALNTVKIVEGSVL